MKKHLLLMLTAAMFFSSSFKLRDEKIHGSFYANIANHEFEIDRTQPVTGSIFTRQGSLNGITPKQTVVNILFEGSTWYLKDSTRFTNKIEFEFRYPDEKMLGVPHLKIDAHYKGVIYYMLPEESTVNITTFKKGNTGSYFTISADFDCVIRSYGYPSDGNEDVALKGYMAGIPAVIQEGLAKKF